MAIDLLTATPFISSRTNPKTQLIRSLRQHKVRQQTGSFLIEGIRHVGEAVEAGYPIESIWFALEQLTSPYAQSLIAEQVQRGMSCFRASPAVFESLTEKDHPAGILAIARQRLQLLTDLLPAQNPWMVALVAPQDPGNIGSILRTIDAVGASGLILLDGGADPFHPGAVRASMGALFWHPIVITSFADFSEWAKNYQVHVYGSSAHGDLEYHEVQQYCPPCVLLLGSEREGLTEEQKKTCQEVIRLPMRGRATSLNLAVACGILLYDVLSKRSS